MLSADEQNPEVAVVRPKILVIDDEEWLREMIRLALRQSGYEVVEADNGETGFEMAQKLLPDLILCDVNMGKLDGYSTLSSLRNQPTTAAIPFILMTGLVDKAGMRHAMELGADDYLPKPFTIEALYAAIDSCLKNGRKPRQHNYDSWQNKVRNALNAILAYGEILAEDAESLPPGEVAEMGRIIRDSGKPLQKLIATRASKAPRAMRERPQDGSVIGSASSMPRPTIDTELGLLEGKVGSNEALKYAVASVVHDLKGEFGGLGFVLRDIKNCLRRSAKAESAHKRLSSHLRHIEAHLKLIEAFIETGLPLTEPVNVIETLREVESLCAVRLPKNVSFQLLLPERGSDWNILANRDVLIGICRELIRNAGTAMHTNGGTLVISLTRTTDGIEILVKDTGPGFPREIRDRVFTEPVGKSARAGWGLYLAQRVATAMGGLIKLKETSEAGSVIALWLQRLRTKGT